MEPRPWLEEDATEIEKALLRAGRADGPRKQAAAHLLAVMQTLPPTVDPSVAPRPNASGPGAAGPAATVKSAGVVRWMKIGLLAIAAGGAAIVTQYFARPDAIAPSAGPAMQKTAPASPPGEAPAPVQALATPEGREDPPAVREEGPRLAVGEVTPRRKKASPPGRAREAAYEANESPLDGSLGNETRALDRAREALDAHRPAEAMHRLDEYQRRFPQGRLRPEAMVLRLAALVQAGRRGAADSLANQLLADQAYQTYAPRIRSLLGEAKP
jgi:hypothetical protein